MIQIKLFTETTFSGKSSGPGALTVEGLQQIVNNFLPEKKDEIIVRDIKYSFNQPNPNNSAKVWTIMVIYET